MPQLIRALIVLLSAAIVLALVFVVGWLALALVLVMLVVAQFRRLFGGARPGTPVAAPSSGAARRAERAPVVLEGSFVRESDAGDARPGGDDPRPPSLGDR